MEDGEGSDAELAILGTEPSACEHGGQEFWPAQRAPSGSPRCCITSMSPRSRERTRDRDERRAQGWTA